MYLISCTNNDIDCITFLQLNPNNDFISHDNLYIDSENKD